MPELAISLSFIGVAITREFESIFSLIFWKINFYKKYFFFFLHHCLYHKAVKKSSIKDVFYEECLTTLYIKPLVSQLHVISAHSVDLLSLLPGK